MTRRRLILGGLLVCLLLFVGLAASPRNPLGYLLRAAFFQAEMLWDRVPLEEAIAAGEIPEDQVQKLRLVPEIKAYGRQLGLEHTDNYSRISPHWQRTIWNVSAAQRLSFRNKRWWFPIVGSVPYLGFFQERDARDLAVALTDEGYEAYVRTAGAYSTLGWFEDPVLPRMLAWTETQLADTLFHELAHATLWIPGSVQFNESFANFVGEVAAERYLVDKYGPQSPEVAELHRKEADRLAYRRVLHGVYKDLDTLYKRGDLSVGDKLVRKQALLASISTRIVHSDLEDKRRYLRAVRRRPWNNAVLLQFRTYNRSADWFARLLAQEQGDLGRFFVRIDAVTRGADDPYKALALAVGADPGDRKKFPDE